MVYICLMYVWCSRNRPWHCPILFYRNCWRGSHIGTRVIYQTHTSGSCPVQVQSCRADHGAAPLEQLGVQCFALGQCVFVEGGEGQRSLLWRRKEHVFFISFSWISVSHLPASEKGLTDSYRIQNDNFLCLHSSLSLSRGHLSFCNSYFTHV